MSTDTTSRRRVLSGLRSRRTRALLSIGVVLGLGSVTTLAYWTDSATLTGGTLRVGDHRPQAGRLRQQPVELLAPPSR